MQVEPSLLPQPATGGITLIDASAGFIPAAIVAVLGGLVAIALAVVCGSMGNPIAAPFVLGASLLFLAADGGSSLGFLWRTTPGRYIPLLFEAIGWFGLVLLTLALTSALRNPLRRRLPWLVTEQRPRRSLLRGFTDPSSLIGVAVCAVVAGVLAHLMIRSWDIGQVLGALVFAFMVGGMIAQVATPSASPGPILFSPLLLAAYGYLHTTFAVGDSTQLLEAAYRAEEHFGDLPGLAWTLPIHFASAAVAGCALGIGIGQGLLGADQRVKPEVKDSIAMSLGGIEALWIYRKWRQRR